MLSSSADPVRWRRLSHLLDEALELASRERSEWLQVLAVREPDLAAELAQLLADHEASAQARFLTGVAGPPGDAEGVSASLAGQTLGAYTLERPLGQGGMGSVWLAHRSDGNYVGLAAVKLLNLSLVGRAGCERFRREGSLLARLAHPHIARLLDAGVTAGGQPFLVLEYVEGERIDRFCDDRNLDVATRVRLFLDVLAAVMHSHSHLVIHRDIKPDNVLVTAQGSVKLLDFGIAKLLEENAASADVTELTREGGRVLTPQYAAPEQLLGEPVTTATDVYALGVLLYVLLGGQHPAGRTQSPVEMARSIVEVAPPRLSASVASTRTLPADGLTDNAARRSSTPEKLKRLLQGDLDNIVAKALKKSPAERYATAEAFADDLRRHLADEPVSAHADAFWYRATKFARRNRFSVAAGALAVGAVCAGLAGALWQANEARHQRDRALALLDRSNAVIDFFDFMLTDAGPPDKPQTIHSMLARSESLLRNEHAGHPAQQAAILLAQASYHVTVGDAAQAEPKLRRILTLLADGDEGGIRAEASCMHGFAVSLLGDAAAGTREIEDTLRDPTLPAFAAASCHQQLAFIAQNQGDGAATQRSAQAGLDVLKTAERPYPRLQASLLGDLAYAEQLQGRNGNADRLYAEALARLTAMGRDRTPLAIGIQNNWAIASLAAGDIKRALALYEQSARALRERDPDGALPAYLSANLARALELMGRPEQALEMYERARAEAVRGNRLDSKLFALLGSVSAYCDLGDLERAAKALAEARAMMSGTVPAGSPPALAADTLQGRLALLRGELEEAERLFTATLADFEARKVSSGSVVMLRIWRSEVALRQTRTEEALAEAQRALDLARRLQAGIPWSSRTGLAQLALADALSQAGRTSEARTALVSATEHLRHALGEEHPLTGRAMARQTADRAS
jgi:serine/threonine protein kinase